MIMNCFQNKPQIRMQLMLSPANGTPSPEQQRIQKYCSLSLKIRIKPQQPRHLMMSETCLDVKRLFAWMKRSWTSIGLNTSHGTASKTYMARHMSNLPRGSGLRCSKPNMPFFEPSFTTTPPHWRQSQLGKCWCWAPHVALTSHRLTHSLNSLGVSQVRPRYSGSRFAVQWNQCVFTAPPSAFCQHIVFIVLCFVVWFSVVVSCLFVSCRVVSCLVLSCLVLCCLGVLWCLVLWCLVVSCLVVSCLVVSCLVERENSSVESILSLSGVHRLSTNFRCWRKKQRCVRKCRK